jgi:hypothetical protein
MTTLTLLTLSRTALLLGVACGYVCAQTRDAKQCNGPIYEGKDIARLAKIIEYPNMGLVANRARKYNFQGEIRAEFVLCRDGHVTDIHIITGLPENLAEFATAAIYTMRFTPAEMNWHTVSQRVVFEFSIHGDVSGVREIDSRKAAGRLVEDLDIIGNRRITKEQIIGWIKTRPGDTYNSDQVQKDLLAVVATGYFDARSTRVTLEDGVRGGLRIIFEVMELPLIAEIKFEGLKEADRSAIIEELRKQHVDIQKGAPVDTAKLKQAERVIRSFFESQGWRDVKAETLVENLSATEVAVTFKVTAYKFGS